MKIVMVLSMGGFGCTPHPFSDFQVSSGCYSLLVDQFALHLSRPFDSSCGSCPGISLLPLFQLQQQRQQQQQPSKPAVTAFINQSTIGRKERKKKRGKCKKLREIVCSAVSTPSSYQREPMSQSVTPRRVVVDHSRDLTIGAH